MEHFIREEELNEKEKITLWMIRNIHKILLNGVRGKDKNPGEFRNEQNWIGKPGSKIEAATFVPVAPEQLLDALENLEKYISEYDEQSALVQAAIIHAQFEKIPPFKDENETLVKNATYPQNAYRLRFSN